MQTPLIFQFDQAHLRLRDFAVSLELAAGGYTLNVLAEADHRGLQKGWPIHFTGEIRLDVGQRLSLGSFQQSDRQGPLVLRDIPVPISWSLPLSYEALDAIEQVRDGKDLPLFIGAHAVIGAPLDNSLSWPEASSQISIAVDVGHWVPQLEQIHAAAGFHFVVHPESHSGRGERAIALKSLVTARRLLEDGLYVQAVAEARKVLDILDDIDPIPTAEELKSVKARDRDKMQRWADVRQSVQRLANAAPHADPVTAEISWDRGDAIAALVTIGGLLARIK